jgi:hypothetical protein
MIRFTVLFKTASFILTVVCAYSDMERQFNRQNMKKERNKEL